jgi:hypothetical protein
MIKLLDDEVGLSLPLGVNILGARAIRPFAVTDYYKDKFVGHLQITHDDIETIGERMGGKLRPHALLPGIVRIEYPSPAVEVSFTSATFICETRAEGSVGEVPYKGLTGRLSQGTDRLDVMTFELALPNIPQRQFTP